MTPVKSILFSYIFTLSARMFPPARPNHILPKCNSRGSAVPRLREHLQNRANPSAFYTRKFASVISDISPSQRTPACLRNTPPDDAAAPFRLQLLLSRPLPDLHISHTISAAVRKARIESLHIPDARSDSPSLPDLLKGGKVHPVSTDNHGYTSNHGCGSSCLIHTHPG